MMEQVIIAVICFLAGTSGSGMSPKSRDEDLGKVGVAGISGKLVVEPRVEKSFGNEEKRILKEKNIDKEVGYGIRTNTLKNSILKEASKNKFHLVLGNTLEELNEIMKQNNKQNIIQGDIKVSPIHLKRQKNEKRNLKINGIWPNDIVYYEISKDFMGSDRMSTIQRRILQIVMDGISRLSCVKFHQRTSEDYWIKFAKGPGCSSFVGRVDISHQPQEVTLHPGCFVTARAVIHELLHALGVEHEQSRPDRDRYVKILYENIAAQMDVNFEKDEGSSTLGRNYDYKSVMHYHRDAFSKNGQDTIEAIDEKYTKEIGVTHVLSNGDIIDINLLYKCKGKTRYVGEWTEFDPCTAGCTKSRQRFCGSELSCPEMNAVGLETQVAHCSARECNMAVNGHWGHWSRLTPCTKTCGEALRTRTRKCNNPAPRNGGKQCPGSKTNAVSCNIPYCNATCGGTFEVGSKPVYIYSPGYPIAYPENQTCYYGIYATPGSRIKLSFTSFKVEQSDRCLYDYVEVYHVMENNTISLVRLCVGDLGNDTFISVKPFMMIQFTSDASYQLKGFKARIEAITQSSSSLTSTVFPDNQSQSPTALPTTAIPNAHAHVSHQNPQCGGNFIAMEKESYITSSNFPGHYPFNQICTYTIVAKPGDHIQLVIVRFSLEYSSGCFYDSLTIYFDEGMKKKAAKLCGNLREHPIRTFFRTPGSVVILTFKSDGSNAYSGFKLMYKLVSSHVG